MQHSPELRWLPRQTNWREHLGAASAWQDLYALARSRIDAAETRSLERKMRELCPKPPEDLATPSVRLAILASSTVDHLLPAIRVGGLRRNMHIECYTPHYGQHIQALIDPGSPLHAFQPNAVLFALDACHLLTGIEVGQDAAEVERRISQIGSNLAVQWERARRAFRCQIIQQTLMPVFSPLMGSNEHRLPGSYPAALARLNTLLRNLADAAGVDLLALDSCVTTHGLTAWHDPALWHRAKQEVHPSAAPYYGDLVGRLLAAARGQSAKALVLDLDNTLWGGVIGDDGLEGITLGQGNALGEAFVAFQHYVRDLGRRGVILAVCSKNDESNALEPFEKHPDMVLKRSDVACFVANWTDKAANLRQIADTLNIGIDSLVFVDDNPAERAIIRRELPMVAVPELPEDPTLYPGILAEAGYFESLQLTQEDLVRTELYRANAQRSSLLTSATDMKGYLQSLKMQAVWGRFDKGGQTRIVQLINKTNQFNLTTRRRTDEEITALIENDRALTLQIRLVDTFGDNGVVAIVIGLFDPGSQDIRLDTWLMSCRVLGRGMEEETLNLVVEQALALGARRLIGVYRPTAKNGMVRDHYASLGFGPAGDDWILPLDDWTPKLTFIDSEMMSQ